LELNNANVALNSLIVFPNPFKDGFNISLLERDKFNYQLIDITGKVVKSSFELDSYSYIETYDLASGVYLKKINTADGEIYTEIINRM